MKQLERRERVQRANEREAAFDAKAREINATGAMASGYKAPNGITVDRGK